MSVPEVAPYTAEELEALGRKHVPCNLSPREVICNAHRDITPWPCPTARLLATLAQERAVRLSDETGEALHKVMNEASAEYVAQQAVIATLRATVEAKDAEIAEIAAERDRRVKQKLDADAALYDIENSLREQLRQQAERAEKTAAAITAAGFALMETSGAWSIHDVREDAKKWAARDALMIDDNLRLESENAALKAQVESTERLYKYAIETNTQLHKLVGTVGRDESLHTAAIRVITSLRAATKGIASKDAILRECAQTFRAREARFREEANWCRRYGQDQGAIDFDTDAASCAAVAAKCEAALGTGEGK